VLGIRCARFISSGKVKEFVRICFTPPAAAPSTPPALPHGYSVLKIDSQKIFDRYVRLWPWTKEVWGSFETFSAAGGIGVIAIAPNRTLGGLFPFGLDLVMLPCRSPAVAAPSWRTCCCRVC